MDTKRLTVVVGLIGAALGAALDLYFSFRFEWGYSFGRNLISGGFGGLLFYFVARASLSQSSGDHVRVEQVIGKKRRMEDCYESIVVQQERY